MHASETFRGWGGLTRAERGGSDMNFIFSPFVIPVAGCLVAIVAIVSGIWLDGHKRRMKSEERIAMIPDSPFALSSFTEEIVLAYQASLSVWAMRTTLREDSNAARRPTDKSKSARITYLMYTGRILCTQKFIDRSKDTRRLNTEAPCEFSCSNPPHHQQSNGNNPDQNQKRMTKKSPASR